MGLNSFISWLLYSSLMGSILIGFIIVIRLVLKNRMGANWQYLIWFLLILKLLIPYAPESSFSVFNILNHLTTGNYFQTKDAEKIELYTDKRSPITKLWNTSDDYALSVNRTFFDSGDGVVFAVWLIGVISLTAYLIKMTIKQNVIIKNSLRVKDSGIIRLFAECKHTINVKGSPLLVESATIRSPMAVGATGPHIILPTGIIDNVSKSELRFILLHELAHLKRGDLYINWITVYLQILHWFNPLIWYAFYQMRQDREVACDAYVLSALKPDEYKSYGATIISLLEKYSYPAWSYTIAGFTSGKDHIKNRIAMIATYKKGTVARVIWGILLFLLAGCFVLTSAQGTYGAAQTGKSPKLNQNIAYEDLSSYFRGYNGTFVLLDLERDRYQVYNDDNSRKRVSPNSTYKIISSLVGLETGVLTDETTRLEWDGTTYSIERWNSDQTLASAMAYSVSWYFQKVDSVVGKTIIENYLKQIGYGNYDLAGGLTDFWLESSLEISPIEQVEMLKKLYTYEMPFSRRNIDIVKKVIQVSEQDRGTLYGKTGTGIVNGNSINGWFVGYVESEGKVYIFATNIQGKERADGANAKNITCSILKDKNIL
ncbi:Regulatory protein BlaR1 [Sporomusa ovata DSM 2662]|uniref:Regulatory sensor-transducer, BlaR1/MecR1 family n=1 Tax=Sporomusa ovata TaxID=2378 RepID=A0A0U1KZM4_9FIRM|nr:BlaR1 family beta-lactam sensor/signal transducer [Sporomusa ovata]EQB29601.1 regulatory protein BlaR1 [Sporomusa ovata DSM 2662]CQR72114.1 Regulatory sensor-transducer, BlaR1/MecR1 family [Sporomusa ovata]